MKWKQAALVLFIGSCASLQAQNVNIPDVNFKSLLLNNSDINTNGDNEIQVSEAIATDSIVGLSLSITSIQGIEAFTNLTFLSLPLNPINSIDISQNTQLKSLILPHNNLSSIDVTNNLLLEDLVLTDNNISSLDIALNVNLKRLEVSVNNIPTLGLTPNTDLEILRCSGNIINTLDISMLPHLDILECNGCNLSMLDISNNPQLQQLEAMLNQISSFDFSQNPLLTVVRADLNDVTTIDLSMCPDLNAVGFFGCDNLTTLDVKNGNNGNITNFQANNCPNLTCVQVDDVSNATANWSLIDNPSVYSTNCFAGLGEEEFVEVSVYPNPAKDQLNVTSEGEIQSIQIIAMDGTVVVRSDVSTSFETVDIRDLNAGIYRIDIEFSNKQRTTERFVKQ